MGNPRGQARIEAERRWRAANPRMPTPRNERNREQERKRQEFIKHAINPCYLKEARAILAGKDVRGRNRCTKLLGDHEDE